MIETVTFPENAVHIVPDAVVLVKGWISPTLSDELCAAVSKETLGKGSAVRVYGPKGPFFDRGHLMSRFADRGVTYTYKGKSKPISAMPVTISFLRHCVSLELGWTANCCVVNSYAPGSGIYPHSDSKRIPELGEVPRSWQSRLAPRERSRCTL